MGKISMKIFKLEKGEMEEQEWDKNKYEKPRELAVKRQKTFEVLVPDEPDKVEEVHRELWRIGKNRRCQNMNEEFILTLFKHLRDEH